MAATGMETGATPVNEPVDSAVSVLWGDRSTRPDRLETRPACLLAGGSAEQRDRLRLQTLQQLDLTDSKAVPVLEEAAQTVARLLAAPVCILSVLNDTHQIFKAAVGLSSMGLMNQLAAARELPREESFCTHVVDSQQAFVLENTTEHPAFSKSLLVQQYGIQAYAGVPLMTASGCCIGTLAVMDLMPRQFTPQEMAILELNARWCMSEYERALLLRGQISSAPPAALPSLEDDLRSKINEVRLGLMTQLTQDLRNPLTAITGMANMLSREIYGPLTDKQQEYASIILSSSQSLITLVDEVIELGGIDETYQQLSLGSVDVEMLGQQALRAAEKVAHQHELKLSLSVEPGCRLWVLDKRVVKQMLYNLVSSLVKLSTAGSTVRLHISRKEGRLNLAVWVSNPWLGEDLPQAVVKWGEQDLAEATLAMPLESGLLIPEHSSDPLLESLDAAQKLTVSRQELGLLLSRHLTQIHSGTVAIQGSLETGYRYVIALPAFEAP